MNAPPPTPALFASAATAMQTAREETVALSSTNGLLGPAKSAGFCSSAVAAATAAGCAAWAGGCAACVSAGACCRPSPNQELSAGAGCCPCCVLVDAAVLDGSGTSSRGASASSSCIERAAAPAGSMSSSRCHGRAESSAEGTESRRNTCAAVEIKSWAPATSCRGQAAAPPAAGPGACCALHAYNRVADASSALHQRQRLRKREEYWRLTWSACRSARRLGTRMPALGGA